MPRSDDLAQALERAEARGASEGARARASIRACVGERWAGLHERVGARVVEHARATLERLASFSAELHAELQGCARACELEPGELLALDGGYVEAWLGAGIERSLGFYLDRPSEAEGAGGPMLAGAWALTRAEAEVIELRRVSDSGPLVLALPGSFGLAGVGAEGLVVLGNLLRPAAPFDGVPGSALLRSLLEQVDVTHARAKIEATPLVDGRNWMLSDGRGFLGIEQLGDRYMVTRVSPRTSHVHTNHCFDPALRQREALPRSPASFRRMELASTLYIQQRPSSAEQVLEFLAEIELASFPNHPGERAELFCVFEPRAGRALLRRPGQSAIEVHHFAPAPSVAPGPASEPTS